MEEFTIFTESNEDMGLLFDGYKGIGEQVKSFLGIIEGKISELLKDPQHASADLREEITKFKAAVDKKPTPKPINISKVGSTKAMVKNYRSEMEKVLDRYAKARDKMSFGGNLMRSIIMKPKVYSKEIDSESYAKNNRNIRNIERALDWVEKVLIDLFNLIDQDLNILTLVGKVYGKRKIYEHTEIFQSGDFDQYKDDGDDVLDMPIESIDEATIGAYKNGVLEIPVSNTKYKARVEQLIRRYHAPIDSGNVILVIHGRESFIDAVVKDCGYTRQQAEIDLDKYKRHGYVMTNNPLRVNITNRKIAVGGFNLTYEMLIIHECTHSVVNSIPQGRVLTDNFQEGIAIYESGMLKHMLEIFHKTPTIGRKYYPPLLRSTLQVSNIIKEKGYNYLVKIIRGSILEPRYDEFIHESSTRYNEITEATDDPPPNMPTEGDEKNGEGKEQSEGDREVSQTSDVPAEDAEVHDESQEPEADQPKEEVKESMPKKTDQVESSKNGVRRKKLYVAFIEWAKEYNSKNTFGSIFDKDIFHNVYPFVPEEMRYFYRLANPILCVLSGDLTFFQVSELKKLNAENKEMDKLLIFAATPNDLRIFNKEDKRIYLATEADGNIVLGESIGDTFDLYIQKMIKKGDILNGPLDSESE